VKVLFVTQYFRPEEFRINEVADSLKVKVDKLSILTGQPNYPDGKAFDGYSMFGLSRKVENGLDVIRVPIFPRGQRSKFRLSLNYISFVFSAALFGFSKLRNESFDVIFCYAPSPILQALPGIFLSWWLKAPFVLHVQDLWPESISSTGHVKNKNVLKFISAFVRFIYFKSDLILVSSRPFREEIYRINPSARVEYLPNSVSKSFYESVEKLTYSDVRRDNFSVVFAGNVGAAQSVNTILDAAELLVAESGITIFVYGSGSELDYMRLIKRKKGLSNLQLMGRFPVSEMPGILASASCLLVTLADSKIFRLTVPNKIQAYLAVGKPIIACMAGEGARIVNEAGAGVVCDVDNGKKLAEAIRNMKSLDLDARFMMGRNGRNYFLKHFEHDHLVTKLLGQLRRAIEYK